MQATLQSHDLLFFGTPFTPSFYQPYELAAQKALSLVWSARQALCAKESDAVRALTYRLKSPSSITAKLQRRGLPVTRQAAGMLRDIAGLRVVLNTTPQVYRFSQLLLRSPSIRLIDTKDYIASPKESGYRSLHLRLSVPVSLQAQELSVPVEIQLRTASMDVFASIEHSMCYKPYGLY